MATHSAPCSNHGSLKVLNGECASASATIFSRAFCSAAAAETDAATETAAESSASSMFHGESRGCASYGSFLGGPLRDAVALKALPQIPNICSFYPESAIVVWCLPRPSPAGLSGAIFPLCLGAPKPLAFEPSTPVTNRKASMYGHVHI